MNRDCNGRFIKSHIVPDEWKNNLKKVHKGKHYSPETEFKKGLIPWSKGRKLPPLSEKAREKISISLLGNTHTLGYKHSEETKRKLREASTAGEFRSRENHWNWKGGITPFRHSIESIFEYKQWRIGVFERDNYTCQDCGERGCYLEAHHINEMINIIRQYSISSVEQALGCTELWDLGNGRTLCKECHKKMRKGVAI